MAQSTSNIRNEAIVLQRSYSRDQTGSKQSLDPGIHSDDGARKESSLPNSTAQSQCKNLLSSKRATQKQCQTEFDTNTDGLHINQEHLSSQESYLDNNDVSFSKGSMPTFQFKRRRSISVSVPEKSSEEERDATPVVGPLHERSNSLESEGVLVRRPPLTLSAFRRPEATIRIADPDVSRFLDADFDLEAPSCGILGHGARSTVFLAVRRKDQVKVAIKCVAKHDALRSRRSRNCRRSLDEWEILQQLQHHPNVVSLLDVYETDEEIQLVTEYCRGGELFDAIQRKRDGVCPSKRAAFCEAQGARIASQILSVLKELHEKNIVHRDVKPENILLTSMDDLEVNVKLCDFGLARLLSGNIDSDTSSDEEDSPMTTPRARAYSTVGSDLYAAPEVCVGAGYDTSADVYSLGVTLYVVLSGIPPSYFDIGDDIDSFGVSFPASHWKGIPQDAQELIRLMLDPYPDRRISAAAALEHNWIVRCNKTSQHGKQETVRISRASLFSPSNPRPVIDLELVRTRLYTDMDLVSHEASMKTKRPSGTGSRKRSRRNAANSETTLAAMVGLLEGVAASATAAAAGVVYNAGVGDIHVNDFDDDDSGDPYSLAFLSV